MNYAMEQDESNACSHVQHHNENRFPSHVGALQMKSTIIGQAIRGTAAPLANTDSDSSKGANFCPLTVALQPKRRA